jgi:hypothetical protein
MSPLVKVGFRAAQPKPREDSDSKDDHIFGSKSTKDRIVFMLDHREYRTGLGLADETKFGNRKIYNDYSLCFSLNQAIHANILESGSQTSQSSKRYRKTSFLIWTYFRG